MKKFLISLLSTLFITGCSSDKKQQIKPLDKNSTNFEKIIYSLSEDGYKFSHKKFKRLSFLSCADRIENTDYYARKYECLEMIEYAKINQKRNHSSKKEVDDALLGTTQSIRAIIMRKHFGDTFSYNNLDLKVEEWVFPNENLAQDALIEIERIRGFLIGKPCGFVFREANNLYLFTEYQPTIKCEELERVFKKASKYIKK